MTKRDIEALWAKALKGEPPVDESAEITSSMVNRQTAERFRAGNPCGEASDAED